MAAPRRPVRSSGPALRTALVVPRDPPGLNNFHQVPIGMLYTAAELRRRGLEASFHDLRIGDVEDASAYREIAAADVAVVCTADYDLAQCYPSLVPAAECVGKVKAAGGERVVCVGSHATVDQQMTRRFTGADCAVAGEFELAVPEVVRMLGEGGELPPAWPADGSPRQATQDELAALGVPAFDLAPMSSYRSEGFVDGELRRVNSGLILGNRGCPFACNFCYLLFGRRVRRRPVEATLAELTAMHDEHGIRHFFFLDYTFTLDRRWVQAICAGIRALDVDVSWVCQTRVDCLDESMLRTMKEAGCAGVWLGVESPELEQRRYLDKGRIAFGDIEGGIALIRACGLAALTFVMVGLPNETASSLAGLNEWLERTRPYYSLSTFQRRVGTPLTPTWPPDALDEGWGYLDRRSERLGESQLELADLGWFFDYHERSPFRVANVMRRESAGPQPAVP